MTFHAYPNRISLSIYPINTMIRLITLLLRRNKWTDIASIADLNSVDNEPFHKAMIDALKEAFQTSNVDRDVRYNAFRCNASDELGSSSRTFSAVSESSRGES